MNINSGNIGELAGNPSILDKKERNHFEGIVSLIPQHFDLTLFIST